MVFQVVTEWLLGGSMWVLGCHLMVYIEFWAVFRMLLGGCLGVLGSDYRIARRLLRYSGWLLEHYKTVAMMVWLVDKALLSICHSVLCSHYGITRQLLGCRYGIPRVPIVFQVGTSALLDGC